MTLTTCKRDRRKGRLGSRISNSQARPWRLSSEYEVDGGNLVRRASESNRLRHRPRLRPLGNVGDLDGGVRAAGRSRRACWPNTWGVQPDTVRRWVRLGRILGPHCRTGEEVRLALCGIVYGHGPQFASRIRKSVMPVVPSPSMSASGIPHAESRNRKSTIPTLPSPSKSAATH